MPRLMSFAKTQQQFRDRTKTVTRRDGWLMLKPGDILEGVTRLPHAGPFERMGLIRVKRCNRQQLSEISARDLAKEGFPDMTPSEFVAMYCAPGKPDPQREVTRIEFEYV